MKYGANNEFIDVRARPLARASGINYPGIIRERELSIGRLSFRPRVYPNNVQSVGLFINSILSRREKSRLMRRFREISFVYTYIQQDSQW